MSVRIVVYGISGAGKSTLVDTVSAKYANIASVSAGALVMEKECLKSRDDFFERTVDQILEDQRVLIDEFNRFCNGSDESTIVLDAHLELRYEDGFVTSPPWVTKGLEPSALVFVDTSVEVISQQCIKDLSRNDRPLIPLVNLAAQRQRLLRTFENRVSNLNIPGLVIGDGPVERRVEILFKFMNTL